MNKILTIEMSIQSKFRHACLKRVIRILFDQTNGDYKKDYILGFNVPIKMQKRCEIIFARRANQIAEIIREAKRGSKWYRECRFDKVSQEWIDDYIDDIYTINITVS